MSSSTDFTPFCYLEKIVNASGALIEYRMTGKIHLTDGFRLGTPTESIEENFKTFTYAVIADGGCSASDVEVVQTMGNPGDLIGIAIAVQKDGNKKVSKGRTSDANEVEL